MKKKLKLNIEGIMIYSIAIIWGSFYFGPTTHAVLVAPDLHVGQPVSAFFSESTGITEDIKVGHAGFADGAFSLQCMPSFALLQDTEAAEVSRPTLPVLMRQDKTLGRQSPRSRTESNRMSSRAARTSSHSSRLSTAP